MTQLSPVFPAAIPKRGPIRVLFCCAGRRVELLAAFRRAAKSLGRALVAYGTDRSWLAPAMHLVDRGFLSPPIENPDYIDFLLGLVKKHSIQLLVPLIDSDLLKLSLARDRFARLGCTVLISSPRVVAICRDKLLSFQHLIKSRIPTPKTWSLDEALRLRNPRFPLYVKPRAGSAARGHYLCDDRASLDLLAHRVTDAIVQEYIRGHEYTLDAYAGFDGRPQCIVPRLRLEVRTGEVSKGRTERNRPVMAVGAKVVRSLADCVGVITIQCIQSEDGAVRVIEINPRVGGGIPLAISAGADFPRWILSELSGKPPRIRPTAFEDGLYMLRYDEAVVCSGARMQRLQKSSRR